jgi:hypothetical protein
MCWRCTTLLAVIQLAVAARVMTDSMAPPGDKQHLHQHITSTAGIRRLQADGHSLAYPSTPF